MIELETSHLPELTDYMQFWKGYVDDAAICFIKVGSVNYISSVLNSFVMNVNVKFAYELEHEEITILRCICEERERRFTQQFTGKLPTIIYIWIGMHLYQLAGKEVHLRHL